MAEATRTSRAARTGQQLLIYICLPALDYCQLSASIPDLGEAASLYTRTGRCSSGSVKLPAAGPRAHIHDDDDEDGNDDVDR